jgi:hypothetical protein
MACDLANAAILELGSSEDRQAITFERIDICRTFPR